MVICCHDDIKHAINTTIHRSKNLLQENEAEIKNLYTDVLKTVLNLSWSTELG